MIYTLHRNHFLTLFIASSPHVDTFSSVALYVPSGLGGHRGKYSCSPPFLQVSPRSHPELVLSWGHAEEHCASDRGQRRERAELPLRASSSHRSIVVAIGVVAISGTL